MKSKLLVAGILIGCGPANAAIVTAVVEGTITSIEAGYQGLITDIEVGDSFIYRMTFDTDTPDQNTTHQQSAYWTGHYQAIGGDLSVGDFSATYNGGYIHVQNDWYISPKKDSVTYATNTSTHHNAPLQGDRELISIGAGFVDPSQTVFSSDALPATAPDLNSFSQTEFSLVFSNDYTSGVAFDAKRVQGEITSLTYVPLPAAAWMLLSALLTLMSPKVLHKTVKKLR